MYTQGLLQQIDQECKGLDYDTLSNKAKELVKYNYMTEADRIRALTIIEKAIALHPDKAKAYNIKGKIIAMALPRSLDATPKPISKESYLTAFENLCKAWTIEKNDKEIIVHMNELLEPPFEAYCPGKMASVKQYLTEDQINDVAKLIVATYTETDLKNKDKRSFYKEIYKLAERILLVYKNKDLLNFQINLGKVFPVYDTTTDPGNYELDQAAWFLDLGDDEKGKSIYQTLLARDQNYPFINNQQINSYYSSDPTNPRWNVPDHMIKLLKLIKMDPDYPYNYYTAARIIEAFSQNEIEKATEYYSKAESLIKDQYFAWQGDCLWRLARLLSIEGKSQQALIAINKAQAIEPASPKISLEKGRILKSCGQVTLAYSQFERAQKLIGEVGKNAKEDIVNLIEATLKEKEELLRYFGSKIMQDQVDKVKEVLDYDSAAQNKKDMAKIQENQALKEYYEQFVFAFSSLYGTSQVVISGQLSIDASNTWIDLGAKGLSLIPFCGETIESIVSAVSQTVIAADMKKKASLFCLLAANQSELDDTVSYIARKIVLNPIKRRRLVKLSANKQGNETVSEFWKKMNKVYEKFKSVAGFEEYNLRSNTAAAKLAVKDTATLIASMIKNETLLRKTAEVRSDEIVELFFDMEEEALEKEAEAKKNVINVIPVETTSGRVASCFGFSKKSK